MLFILLFFIVGITVGRLVRKHRWISTLSSKLTFLSVLLLLFLLGYEAANNPQISAHFDVIGLQGLSIGLCATAGSLVFGWIFAKTFLGR